MSIVTEAEVARKLIGKQKKTKQEVVDGLSLDQHECAVWQCVFREDDEMCILLERAMQRKLAEEHAKNISSTLEKSKTDIQRDAVWHIHSMLAVTLLTGAQVEAFPHWQKELIPVWLEAYKQYPEWLINVKAYVRESMQRRREIISETSYADQIEKQTEEWNKPLQSLLSFLEGAN